MASQQSANQQAGLALQAFVQGITPGNSPGGLSQTLVAGTARKLLKVPAHTAALAWLACAVRQPDYGAALMYLMRELLRQGAHASSASQSSAFIVAMCQSAGKLGKVRPALSNARRVYAILRDSSAGIVTRAQCNYLETLFDTESDATKEGMLRVGIAQSALDSMADELQSHVLLPVQVPPASERFQHSDTNVLLRDLAFRHIRTLELALMVNALPAWALEGSLAPESIQTVDEARKRLSEAAHAAEVLRLCKLAMHENKTVSVELANRLEAQRRLLDSHARTIQAHKDQISAARSQLSDLRQALSSAGPDYVVATSRQPGSQFMLGSHASLGSPPVSPGHAGAGSTAASTPVGSPPGQADVSFSQLYNPAGSFDSEDEAGASAAALASRAARKADRIATTASLAGLEEEVEEAERAREAALLQVRAKPEHEEQPAASAIGEEELVWNPVLSEFTLASQLPSKAVDAEMDLRG